MSTFIKGNLPRTPFGRNEFLRSTKDVATESYTCAASTVPAQTIDGFPNQKILQPGTVMAKLTSGADSGKVGPFQAGVSDGRQTLTNIVGIDLTFLPWQLIERDVEISAVTDALVVQAWCFEMDAGGNLIPLSNATAAAMIAQKRLTMNFA
jgi:hypothetical protein